MAILICQILPSSGNIKRVLYDTDSPKLYKYIIPGTLKNEVSKAGTFDFTYYYNNSPEQSDISISERSTCISVEDNYYTESDERRYLFYGRVSEIEVNINGEWHVTCEGLLANLLDFPMYMPTSDATIQSNDRKEGIWYLYTKSTDYLFEYALTAYSEGLNRSDIQKGIVDDSNKMDNPDPSDESKWFIFEYPWSQTVGDFINSELVGRFGGLLKLRYKNNGGIYGILDWEADPIAKPNKYPLESQSIIYGQNILEASMSTQNIDFNSGIFPIGIRIDNETKNENGKFWNEEQIGNHYRPTVFNGSSYTDVFYKSYKAITFDKLKMPMDTSSDITKALRQLQKYAERYIRVYCNGPLYSLNAKVVDAHLTDPSIDRIKIMGKYRINIPFPGKEGAFNNVDLFCLSYELDIANPQNNSYTFGHYIPPELMNAKYISKG